jgi:hypothetical protein
MAQCTGQSDTPGKLQKFGSSLTVGEDGLIKQSRFFLKASRTTTGYKEEEIMTPEMKEKIKSYIRKS